MKPNLPSRKDELDEQELELTQLVGDSIPEWKRGKRGKKGRRDERETTSESGNDNEDEGDTRDRNLGDIIRVNDDNDDDDESNDKVNGTTIGQIADGTEINDESEIFLRSRFEDVLRRFHQSEEDNESVSKSQTNNDKSGEKDEDNSNNIINESQEQQEEDLDDKFVAEEHRSKSSIFIKENSRLALSNEVVPPENFSHVIGEIYRSSFPRVENFSFLSRRLKLKSILMLIPEEYPQENLDFLKAASIQLFQVGMSGNKEPFVNLPSGLLTKALGIVLNPENQPILIHCNRGKHRTGCLVGCIRKLQNWSLTMIFDEYRRFAFPKARALDQQFIELYDDEEIKRIASERGWLPLQW